MRRTVTMSDKSIDNYLLGIGFAKPFNTKEDATEYEDPDNNFHLELFDSLTQSYKHSRSQVQLKRTRVHAKKSYPDEGRYGDFVFSEVLRFEYNKFHKIFIELIFDPNKPSSVEVSSSNEELSDKVKHEAHKLAKDKKLQILISKTYETISAYSR